jgi:hypothetical protein
MADDWTCRRSGRCCNKHASALHSQTSARKLELQKLLPRTAAGSIYVILLQIAANDDSEGGGTKDGTTRRSRERSDANGEHLGPCRATAVGFTGWRAAPSFAVRASQLSRDSVPARAEPARPGRPRAVLRAGGADGTRTHDLDGANVALFPTELRPLARGCGPAAHASRPAVADLRIPLPIKRKLGRCHPLAAGFRTASLARNQVARRLAAQPAGVRLGPACGRPAPARSARPLPTTASKHRKHAAASRPDPRLGLVEPRGDEPPSAMLVLLTQGRQRAAILGGTITRGAAHAGGGTPT